MYLAKIQNLEGQLDSLQKKHKELRTRRNLEVEGYKTDLEQIRKKIRVYDEYLHRVKKLIDTDPAKAIEMAKTGNELDVDPIKEQLQAMENRLEGAKTEPGYDETAAAEKVAPLKPEKENAEPTAKVAEMA